jgi:hypothetical protein
MKPLAAFPIGGARLFDEPELAGDHPTLIYEPTGQLTVEFRKESNGRACGDCQLCCKLVPVPTIEKPAGKRCKYSKVGKGCTVYETRPFDCRSWSCRWMADRAHTEGMSRPDRAHFVIDLTPDYITLTMNDTGEETKIGVIQVWVDPAFPEVAKGAELRAYMQQMAEMAGNVTAHNEWERMLMENWEAVTE